MSLLDAATIALVVATGALTVATVGLVTVGYFQWRQVQAQAQLMQRSVLASEAAVEEMRRERMERNPFHVSIELSRTDAGVIVAELRNRRTDDTPLHIAYASLVQAGSDLRDHDLESP